jgi:hypothetical protein
MIILFEKLAERMLHHHQIGTPRNHHHLTVTLDIKLEKTTFKHRGLITLTGDLAWAHFDARRLVAVIVTMKLETPFATDEYPVATLRGALVEEAHMRAKLIKPTRTARDQVLLGWHLSRQRDKLDPLKLNANGREVGIAQDLLH